MSFFSKLLGKNNWKETLIKDLIILTAVDGDTDKEEISLAYKIAITELGFTEQRFLDMIEDIEKIEDIYPTKIEDKIAYIQYLVKMTYADGVLHKNEIIYMKKIAMNMDLSNDLIDNIIIKIEQFFDNTTVELTYISTITTTMGMDFNETEDIDDVKMKSIDFTEKILKINGEAYTNFTLYENTSTRRSWLLGEEGEIYSQVISVEPEDNKVQSTVIIPTFAGGGKPSIRTFTYNSNIEFKNFPIEESANIIDENLGIKDMSKQSVIIAQGVNQRIKSFKVAEQFILEELEAASDGNNFAKDFVKNSGIPESKYYNAMSNSFEEVDGMNGPQLFLVQSCMVLGDMDLIVKTRIEVVDYIMKKWKIGKYA